MFNVNNKNILITGATSGIGKESALALAKMGANITFIARNKVKAENLLNDMNKISSGQNSFIIADLSSQKDIKAASEDYINKNISLDILLNNAGLINFKRRETIDGLEETFALNHLAYFSLTNLLLDKIKESGSARIVNVSSGAHQFVKRMNFDDIQSEKSYKPFQVYGYTKLANILFTKKLSSILKDKKISVNCLHPGVVEPLLDKIIVTILTKFYHLSLNHLCVLLKKVQKHLFIYVLRQMYQIFLVNIFIIVG